MNTRIRIWGMVSVVVASLYIFAAAAQGAGVSFVQATGNTTSVAASSSSIAFSANTRAGDLILIGFDYDANSTPSSVTDSQGNVFTPIGSQLTSPGGTRSRVYYAKSIKGGSDRITVKLTATSSWIEIYLSEYSGVNASAPIDTQVGATGSSGMVSSGSAKTSVAGDLIYGYCVGDGACGVGSGFATLSNFNSNLLEYRLTTAAGVYSATGTANKGWSMQMVALKPATAAPSSNPATSAKPVITSPTTASGTTGAAFSYQIAATNTPTRYTTRGLPGGLGVNGATGLISGTLTRTGTSTIVLDAINSSGTGSATLTLTVSSQSSSGGSPLVVLTSSLPSGRTGASYSSRLLATGGTTPYAWTVTKGSLPAGLSLSSAGAITGTPTQAATNSFLTFQVMDSSNPPLTSIVNLTLTIAASTAQGELMALSSNGRYLINSSTGQPVFIVGDDAFDLCCMLSASDVSTYLNDRAGKGFNAIWMAAVDNGFSANAPKNFSGNYPFDGSDFTNFDSTYWANIDSIITQASNLGITVFLNPFFPGNGSEPGYLNSVLAASDATMSAYGTFLGNRYKGYDNIVWLLGGDSKPTQTGLYSKLSVVGAAIAVADPNHLITVEACEQCATNGYSSVGAFEALSLLAPSWLKLNWAYPQLSTTVAAAQNAYNQSPLMPPMCGENFYELENSTTELNVRFEQYAEILSGCYAGRIFGNGAIWSFDSKNGSSCCTSGSPTWQSQLSSAGSLSQEYQGKLFRSREHWLLAPDMNHTVVTAGYGSGLTMTTAARTSDGQTIIAYIPNGNATTITVNLAKITSSTETIQGWWFNPRTGTGTSLGTFPNSGTQTFTAPDSNDWVLVLDDATAKLPTPGTSIMP